MTPKCALRFAREFGSHSAEEMYELRHLARAHHAYYR